ncbi:MAG: Hsp20/alpha crystallin family protein [Kiritimatiellia bacterium]
MAIKDLVPTLNRKRSNLPGLRRDTDPLAQIQSEMNRLFDDLFTLTGSPFDWSEDKSLTAPRVDVAEEDKEITVTAELPGMDEKDVQVEMDDYAITIRGEKRAEHTDKKRNWSRRELHYGSFHRVVPLPSQVDGAKAKANFRKGVLTITAPKRETTEPRRRITIQTD